jgi:hypothetical protein
LGLPVGGANGATLVDSAFAGWEAEVFAGGAVDIFGVREGLIGIVLAPAAEQGAHVPLRVLRPATEYRRSLFNECSLFAFPRTFSNPLR